MKHLIIICEGETERDFCKEVLYPHFFSLGILVFPPLIRKSGGGIVAWASLKKQIENHLFTEPNAVVTTLIDFYGLEQKRDFPGLVASKLKSEKNECVQLLEEAMVQDVPKGFNRFIPYIQLHDFEGLLFNEITVFTQQIPSTEILNLQELTYIIDQYPNPELINDKKETTPSRRLQNLIAGYKKTVHGPILAEAIGIKRIRAKCPRFNNWITKLEQI